MLVFLKTLTRTVDHLEPVGNLLLYLGCYISIGHLDTINLGLVFEQLLHGNLLGDSAIGVSTPLDTLHSSLHTHLLDIRTEDGIIANHPYYLVDNSTNRILLLSLSHQWQSQKRQGHNFPYNTHRCLFTVFNTSLLTST